MAYKKRKSTGKKRKASSRSKSRRRSNYGKRGNSPRRKSNRRSNQNSGRTIRLVFEQPAGETSSISVGSTKPTRKAMF